MSGESGSSPQRVLVNDTGDTPTVVRQGQPSGDRAIGEYDQQNSIPKQTPPQPFRPSVVGMDGGHHGYPMQQTPPLSQTPSPAHTVHNPPSPMMQQTFAAHLPLSSPMQRSQSPPMAYSQPPATSPMMHPGMYSPNIPTTDQYMNQPVMTVGGTPHTGTPHAGTPHGPRMSPPSPTGYSEYASPAMLKITHSNKARMYSVDSALSPVPPHGGSAMRSSIASTVVSTPETLPLLPLERGKGDERERQTARLLFVWLGVSTLVLQTTIFITMEDVQDRFFPNMHYAFYAHNIFACSFFIGTAAFACFPARLLFSLRLLSLLNFLAILLATAFFSVVIAGQKTEWAYITALVLVGCITFMSVLLIPVVFTSASAVPGECAMYAAFGQGLGAVATALVAVALVTFLKPKRFLLTCSLLAVGVHSVAIVSLQRLRKFTWASRRLKRLSDAHSAAKSEDKRRETRHRARRLTPKFSGLVIKVFPQLMCAFLSTFVSFCLFPAFSILLGHNVSRGFGVAMVALFHASDQIGRHIPEFGLGLPPLLLSLLVIARLAFLPLYVVMFKTTAAAALWGTVLFKSMVQGALGFTHGWAVASSFRYIPSGLTKYEVERVQFYLSLSNAIGIPCGALLMSALVYSGYFPRL